MDGLLTPVSTTKVKRTSDAKPLLQEIGIIKERKSNVALDSPTKALEILKNQPDFESVQGVLDYLVTEAERQNGFHLVLPDPVAANIGFELISTTVPDYWQTLKERKSPLKQLARCLRNPCGIGNIISRLQSLTADGRQRRAVGETRDSTSHIADLLDFLESLLRGDQCLTQVWADIKAHGKNATQKRMMWKEFVAQVASGRIVSLAAEAEDVVKEKTSSRTATWLVDGSSYAIWLGRNIANLSAVEHEEDSLPIVVDIYSKSLTLGYAGGYCVLYIYFKTLTI